MRRYVAAILLCAFACAPSFANLELKNEQTDSRWLKVSGDLPFALFGVFVGKGEFKISDRLSLLVEGGYLDPRISIKPTINTFQFTANDGFVGVKFGGGLRWYIFAGCMDGIFVEDFVDTDVLWTYSGNQISYQFNGMNLSVGPIVWAIQNTVHVGYSWVTEIGFVAEAALGINTSAPIAGIPTDKVAISFYDVPNSIPINRIEARLAVGWVF